ncbi:hypothetical protein [Aurantibacter aestuarii]|uniref:Secretion system C-terminal sorting domain-containing protein n=1 Tax=Aurantibacter aestuarii TaxID=1266046 RepID=A0A2T1NDB7_9FLAO|nr:hypothetical protein [Aurantibacter aestuarii]PSG90406.1 hypothetical protein C7H52_03750 [Aurantibacter aestuarii]
MKKILNVLVIAVLAINSLNANNITKGDGDLGKYTEFKLDFVEKNSKVVLKDKFSSILYSEVIENAGSYSKNFDFSLLPEGYYFFEVTTNKVTNRYPVKVTEEFAKVNTKRVLKSYAPTVTLRSNLLYVSQLTTGLTKLKIYIYAKDIETNEFNLLKKELVKDQNFAGRIFKLNKNKATSYKVVIKTKNGDVFEELVNL